MVPKWCQMSISCEAFLTFCLLSFATSLQASCVILLHDLARTSDSMETLKEALLNQNFLMINQGYPSRQYSIEVLANLAIETALKQCPKNMTVNFVTHSLGRILVRQYLSLHDINNLNRVVMLGPPNGGSEVIDKLKDAPGVYFVNDNAGLQLGMGEHSTPKTLGRTNFNVGIIAGTKSINWILSSRIPSTDDGKVSVKKY